MRILPYDVWSKDQAWYPKHVKTVRSTTSSVNSFGMVDTSGDLQHSAYDTFCTAPMNRYDRHNVSWLAWSLYDSAHSPRAYAWHKFLLDPDTSPWKRALRKENAILEGDKGINHVAMLSIDKDTMFKDVVNLCIALRQGSENPVSTCKFIDTYLPKRMDEGFTFSEGLTCYVLERDTNKYGDVAHVFTGGHGFLRNYETLNVKALANCEPELRGPTFRSEGVYNPSDEIWKNTNSKDFIKFLKTGDIAPPSRAQEFKSVFQKSRDTDIAMPNYGGTYYKRTPKEMVQFFRS